VLADGGTPAGDPGDHRGQAWATTPGDRGLDDGAGADDAADEGLDVDMAPHSHESDEDEELAEQASDDVTDGPTTEATEDSTDDSTGGVTDTAWTDAPDRTDAADDDRAGQADQADEQADEPADEQGDTVAPSDTAWSVDDPEPDASDASDASDESGSADEQPAAGRRMSGFDEVVDGGFGLGSAAPIDDGAQPLGHAVKGTREGTAFVRPDDAGYDDVEPDVWFYSEEAARRAGFHRHGE
jgi:hypothetical protein